MSDMSSHDAPVAPRRAPRQSPAMPAAALPDGPLDTALEVALSAARSEAARVFAQGSAMTGDAVTARATAPRRHPERPPWLRVRYHESPDFARVSALAREQKLHTVCQSASCPNQSECWSHGTATFMLGGNVCTRSCGFCDVATGRPLQLDPGEPRRVAESVRALGLHFAVITAVARDELRDGGAGHFADTVHALRDLVPECRVELLIPDFKGQDAPLRTVLEAEPDVLSHNLETVERLQRRVRPQGSYARSLGVLARSREMHPEILTKTSLMLGLGETDLEIDTALRDMLAHRCQLVTLGQYLKPSPKHLPIERYVSPQEFDVWRDRALALGFLDVASGPLVRSSYRAERLAKRTLPLS